MARKITKTQTTDIAQELAFDCTALYIRVSTDKQADEGFSLDAQRTRLDAYCVAQGWTVCADHVYVDSVSGKNTERPAYKAMMKAAKAGAIRRVVAVKLDRVARNTREFLATVDTLTAVDVALVLIKESFDTSTPHGKFALTMFAAMAELEVTIIQERLTEGRNEKARQGGMPGKYTPLGYAFNEDDKQHYSVDPQTAPVISSIFAEFNEGSSLSAIARNLNSQNAPTAKGGKWYPATVKYILRNGFYAGLVQYDGIETQGEHAPIIDRKVYESAITRLHSLKPGPQ